jgi:hypothetical protein
MLAIQVAHFPLSPLPCPTADYRRNERSHRSVLLQGARFALASLAMLQFSVLGSLADRAQAHEKERTRTPIKHVIVIVGENRSFGHLFATYKAKNIANGTLPAVSFVKPSGWVDGHPVSSNGICSKAIFVTVDEGGGYYDSGYVQPLDFFGDGTRIPLIVVSPFTKPGHISHSYSDHVSIWKLIERNWDLPAISSRSRDNLPNPKSDWDNPYVPGNSPAISDLFGPLHFDHDHDGGHDHDDR